MRRSRLRPLLLFALLLTTAPALADEIVPRNQPDYQQPTYVKPAPKGNISLEKQFSGPHSTLKISDRVRLLEICPPGTGPNPNGKDGCAPCRPLHKGDPIGQCAM